MYQYSKEQIEELVRLVDSMTLKGVKNWSIAIQVMQIIDNGREVNDNQ